ncbi:unnamed protein product [Amoebophrya sp. A25]|nr:unnamed protein product [Amoebophrya sp. A25]|eukprot:GSA25T00026152001.1
MDPAAAGSFASPPQFQQAAPANGAAPQSWAPGTAPGGTGGSAQAGSLVETTQSQSAIAAGTPAINPTSAVTTGGPGNPIGSAGATGAASAGVVCPPTTDGQQQAASQVVQVNNTYTSASATMHGATPPQAQPQGQAPQGSSPPHAPPQPAQHLLMNNQQGVGGGGPVGGAGAAAGSQPIAQPQQGTPPQQSAAVVATSVQQQQPQAATPPQQQTPQPTPPPPPPPQQQPQLQTTSVAPQQMPQSQQTMAAQQQMQQQPPGVAAPQQQAQIPPPQQLAHQPMQQLAQPQGSQQPVIMAAQQQQQQHYMPASGAAGVTLSQNLSMTPPAGTSPQSTAAVIHNSLPQGQGGASDAVPQQVQQNTTSSASAVVTMQIPPQAQPPAPQQHIIQQHPPQQHPSQQAQGPPQQQQQQLPPPTSQTQVQQQQQQQQRSSTMTGELQPQAPAAPTAAGAEQQPAPVASAGGGASGGNISSGASQQSAMNQATPPPAQPATRGSPADGASPGDTAASRSLLATRMPVSNAAGGPQSASGSGSNSKATTMPDEATHMFATAGRFKIFNDKQPNFQMGGSSSSTAVMGGGPKEAAPHTFLTIESLAGVVGRIIEQQLEVSRTQPRLSGEGESPESIRRPVAESDPPLRRDAHKFLDQIDETLAQLTLTEEELTKAKRENQDLKRENQDLRQKVEESDERIAEERERADERLDEVQRKAARREADWMTEREGFYELKDQNKREKEQLKEEVKKIKKLLSDEKTLREEADAALATLREENETTLKEAIEKAKQEERDRMLKELQKNSSSTAERNTNPSTNITATVGGPLSSSSSGGGPPGASPSPSPPPPPNPALSTSTTSIAPNSTAPPSAAPSPAPSAASAVPARPPQTTSVSSSNSSTAQSQAPPAPQESNSSSRMPTSVPGDLSSSHSQQHNSSSCSISTNAVVDMNEKNNRDVAGLLQGNCIQMNVNVSSAARAVPEHDLRLDRNATSSAEPTPAHIQHQTHASSATSQVPSGGSSSGVAGRPPMTPGAQPVVPNAISSNTPHQLHSNLQSTTSSSTTLGGAAEQLLLSMKNLSQAAPLSTGGSRQLHASDSVGSSISTSSGAILDGGTGSGIQTLNRTPEEDYGTTTKSMGGNGTNGVVGGRVISGLEDLFVTQHSTTSYSGDESLQERESTGSSTGKTASCQSAAASMESLTRLNQQKISSSANMNPSLTSKQQEERNGNKMNQQERNRQNGFYHVPGGRGQEGHQGHEAAPPPTDGTDNAAQRLLRRTTSQKDEPGREGKNSARIDDILSDRPSRNSDLDFLKTETRMGTMGSQSHHTTSSSSSSRQQVEAQLQGQGHQQGQQVQSPAPAPRPLEYNFAAPPSNCNSEPAPFRTSTPAPEMMMSMSKSSGSLAAQGGQGISPQAGSQNQVGAQSQQHRQQDHQDACTSTRMLLHQQDTSITSPATGLRNTTGGAGLPHHLGGGLFADHQQQQQGCNGGFPGDSQQQIRSAPSSPTHPPSVHHPPIPHYASTGGIGNKHDLVDMLDLDFKGGPLTGYQPQQSSAGFQQHPQSSLQSSLPLLENDQASARAFDPVTAVFGGASAIRECCHNSFAPLQQEGAQGEGTRLGGS